MTDMTATAFKKFIRLAIPAVAAAIAGFSSLSGQPLGQTLYTVGTSYDDEENGLAAYLLWEASERELMDGLSFTVYHKPGGPDAAVEYRRAGTASYEVDGYTIEGILDRARFAGEDPVQLEARIDTLFGSVLAGGEELPLGKKLANVMLIALDDDQVYENLLLLSRVHPGVAMAMGKAWAMPLEQGEHTFEIRQLASGTGSTESVVGRVTVDVGAPRVLPAPDAPHALVETSARGHLNARLIWGTPDPLRRLGLLQHGYRVYRVDRDFAENNDWHLKPPETRGVELLKDQEPAIVQVNNLPIVLEDVITDADAAAIANNTKETDEFFYGDDNGRHHGGDQFPNGGEPFVAGSEYYYYVAALDVLGRPGALSEGRLVMICDRIPPPPPIEVQVENTFSYDSGTGSREHALKVSWEPPEGEDAEDVENYYVYRFEAVEEIQREMVRDYQTPGNLVGGPIHHMADLSYVDNGPEGIDDPSEYGRTYYYTVRAEDNAECEPNLSGHSAPAYGVLRDREGPEAPMVGLSIRSGELFLADEWTTGFVPIEESVPRAEMIQLVCARQNREVAWAEFDLDGENLGRVYFGRSDTASTLVPYLGMVSEGGLQIKCTVGAPGFKRDEKSVALDNHQAPGEKEALEIAFTAGAKVTEVPVAQAEGPHHPVDFATGDVHCTDLNVTLAPGSQEYKVYRRIDDGPLVLVEQGLQDADADSNVTFSDCSMPAVGGDLCYFVQAFDEDGNASAMSEAACTPVLPSQDLPVPMLASAEPVTVDGDAYARLNWFCSPNGVERFEVFATPRDALPEEATDHISVPLGAVVLADGEESFQAFQTGRVGGNLTSDGGAGFTADFPVSDGVTYTFVIRAVGEGAFGSRAEGDPSNPREFFWADEEEDVSTIEVPWPVRGPDAKGERQALQPRILFTDLDLTVGIPVGEFDLRDAQDQAVAFSEYEAPFPVPEEDPMSLLTDAADLFPCVVYRYQVTDSPIPEGIGDLVQVTPLLEDIAFEASVSPDRYNFPPGTPNPVNVVHDRFFLSDNLNTHSTTATHGIYIRDNHPVMREAFYRYLLVQFTPDGEIGRIVPTPPVQILHPTF